MCIFVSLYGDTKNVTPRNCSRTLKCAFLKHTVVFGDEFIHLLVAQKKLQIH